MAEKTSGWRCVPREVQDVGNGTVTLVVDFTSPANMVVTKEFNLHSEAYAKTEDVESLLRSEVKRLNAFESAKDKFATLLGKEIVE